MSDYPDSYEPTIEGHYREACDRLAEYENGDTVPRCDMANQQHINDLLRHRCEALEQENESDVADLVSRCACQWDRTKEGIEATHPTTVCGYHQARATRCEALEGALKKIAQKPECGCKPCTGLCQNEAALKIELEGLRDMALAALSSTPAAVKEEGK